jgi:steroid delta-isomerase-like uncharacterized protein
MKAVAPAAHADQTKGELRNLKAVAEVLEFWNSHDVEGILRFYDDQITWHNIALEEVYCGKSEVRAFLNRLIDAFPDLSFDVTEKFAHRNRVAERWFIHGTHKGTFMGVPPTGRHVDIPGISMVEMKDGRFLSDRFLFEMGVVLRQMGLMPPLTVTSTAPGRVLLWAAVNRSQVAGVVSGLVGGFLAWRWLRRRGSSGRAKR